MQQMSRTQRIKKYLRAIYLLEKYGHPYMLDHLEILEFGAKKYKAKNWLKHGVKSSFRDMHDSMGHHWAESWAGRTEDEESGRHPLEHLTVRAEMAYTLTKLGHISSADK